MPKSASDFAAKTVRKQIDKFDKVCPGTVQTLEEVSFFESVSWLGVQISLFSRFSLHFWRLCGSGSLRRC